MLLGQVTRRVPKKSGGEALEMCFSLRDLAPPAPIFGLVLDRTPLQQAYDAIEAGGAAGALNPDIRKALGIDDKHGARVAAALEKHGVIKKRELYGKTEAFRFLLAEHETGLVPSGEGGGGGGGGGAAGAGGSGAGSSSGAVNPLVGRWSHQKKNPHDTARQRRALLLELIRREGALPAKVLRSYLQV